jgi:hypothetical protein
MGQAFFLFKKSKIIYMGNEDQGKQFLEAVYWMVRTDA